MNCISYNQFFEVIANKTRLKIIESLLESSRCVSELCVKINEEQSKISHNLKILMNCHFVKVKQNGKRRIYSINEQTIKPLMEIVKKHVVINCSHNCHGRKQNKLKTYKVEL